MLRLSGIPLGSGYLVSNTEGCGVAMGAPGPWGFALALSPPLLDPVVRPALKLSDTVLVGGIIT